MMPLRLVTFDVTGTILFFRTPILDKYAATALRYGITADTNVLKKNFKNAWKILNEKHSNYGKDSGLGWKKWWISCVEETFSSYVKPENKDKIKFIADDLITFHTTKEAFDIRPGTEDLLRYLKKKNVKLGVISNYDPRLYDILEVLDLKKYFDFVLVSYDFGFPKPDKRIFEEALRLGKCSSGNEAVHVGDNVELDYKAAKKVGMKAVLLNSDTTELNKSEVDVENVFDDFFSLAKYFKECK